MKSFALYTILVLALFSCKKNKIDQAKVDDDIIKQYMADNSLTATATGTGLYYIVDAVGTGTQATSNSTVTVAYKGYFTSGELFDESDNTGVTFSLNSVIEGWQEGIPFYKEGGSGILLIPSDLGYGSQARSGIPANSVLLFDISLIDVQ